MTEERVPPTPPDDSGDDRESAYELLQRGHALLRRRHHAQAAVVLARAARLEPGRGSILEALGRAYYNSGQHERSRETFAALLEIDPSAHYAHYALGQSLKKLGREREAWTHLRLAVALAPGSALYESALARIPDPHGRPADRGEAEPGDAAAGDAGPGEADPGEADPGEADPGEADPGAARPKDRSEER